MRSLGEASACVKLCFGADVRRLRVPSDASYAQLEQRIREHLRLEGAFLLYCSDANGALRHLTDADLPAWLGGGAPRQDGHYPRLTVHSLPAPIATPEPLPTTHTTTTPAASIIESTEVLRASSVPESLVARPNEVVTVMWTLAEPSQASHAFAMAAAGNIHLRNVAGSKLEPVSDDEIAIMLEDSSFVVYSAICAPSAAGTYTSKFRVFDEEGNVLSEALPVTLQVIEVPEDILEAPLHVSVREDMVTLPSMSMPPPVSEMATSTDSAASSSEQGTARAGEQSEVDTSYSIPGTDTSFGDDQLDGSYHDVMVAVGQALLLQDGGADDQSYCFVNTVR